jgi:hypothetical protein
MTCKQASNATGMHSMSPGAMSVTDSADTHKLKMQCGMLAAALQVCKAAASLSCSMVMHDALP